MKVAGRSVVVTGGASGIGRAIGVGCDVSDPDAVENLVGAEGSFGPIDVFCSTPVSPTRPR